MTIAIKIIYSDYLPDELIQDVVTYNLKKRFEWRNPSHQEEE